MNSVHELMRRWAQETYASLNTSEERKVFSACLKELRELYHFFNHRYEGNTPEDLFRVLAPSWSSIIKFSHSGEAKRTYRKCMNQLQELIELAEQIEAA